MTCCFFGHKDASVEILPELEKTICEHIDKGVYTFYVGNQGKFDRCVYTTLKKLKKIYPDIRYYVVLAYMPCEKCDESIDFNDSIYPDGLEKIPRRFAISRRNRWMVKNSDFVISYVTHSWGGAAQFTEYAERQGKTVVNIAHKN